MFFREANVNRTIICGIATATIALSAGGATALAPMPQQQQQEEILSGPSAPVGPTTGPSWWTFSRGTNRTYLIDVNSVTRNGDEVTVLIARVPTDKPARDYSHTVDQFGIRCAAMQSHVATSSEAFEDGVLEAPYAADEPWSPIDPNGFDDAIRAVACDDVRPQANPYASIRAYIDAGRR